MKQLWVEKYRPQKIADYVFLNDEYKGTVEGWIEHGIPHLLFHGPAGTGKTTLAKLLFLELSVDKSDILELNGSVTNSVDDIRNTIIPFADMMPFGDLRYVLLDEADYLSPNAQAALRGVIEKYSNTVRFVLTCNSFSKIIKPLKSRCSGFEVNKIDQTEFVARVATVLINEGIQFELPALDEYANVAYPDMRKCISLLQQNSQTGTLKSYSSADSGGNDDTYMKLVALMRAGKYKEARAFMVTEVSDHESVYTFMYNNLELWGDTEEKQNEAVLVIKKGLVDHALCMDSEICLAATLISLEMI